MRKNLKKVLAGAAGVAMTATLAPALTATMAGAAGVSSGTPTLSPTSGDSTTDFVLSLPSGAACNEDSAAGGWTVSSFMVPTTTDLATLAFDPSGPSPAATGTYSTFKQPLWQPGGNSFVSRSTVNATPPSPAGPILNPNTFDFDPGYAAGDIPAGAYNIGIACVDETFAIQQYWATKVTVTANPADPGSAKINWAFGAVPSAPTLSGVTGGDLVVSGTVNEDPTDAPAPTSYTVTLTPAGANPAPGGPVVVTAPASGVFSATDVEGVQYGTYDVTATSTNSVGTGPSSAAVNVTVSPTILPPVVSFAKTVTGNDVEFTWAAPTTGTAPTGYQLVITPASGPTITRTLPATPLTYTESNLAVGSYSAVITPLHPSPFIAQASTALPFTVFPDSILIQDITVTRPVGALVLTQVCGAFGALGGEGAQLGFPNGLDPAPAVNSSTVEAPNLATAGIPTGENAGNYGEYPYPTNPDGTSNATYPTRCGIDLGDAQFVRRGAGAGQFFAAEGRINQVTVVDTRDGDIGWNVVGQISDFDGGNGKSFSGSQMGWSPVVTDDTDAFTDSLGNTYNQFTIAGAAIAQNSLVGTEDPATQPNGYDGGDATGGLTYARTLIKSPGFASVGAASSTGGLGTAIADARLKLLIPVTAQSGVYTATLTISTL